MLFNAKLWLKAKNYLYYKTKIKYIYENKYLKLIKNGQTEQNELSNVR